MITDHIGAAFFPDLLWLRMIGRIAMPVFSFFIAEGYRYTRSRRRYLIRLLAFSIVSELPSDLAFYGEPEYKHQNVMFTFFLSFIALTIYDKCISSGKSLQWEIIGIINVLGIGIIALILRTDYSILGIISVFLFYVLREKSNIISDIAGVAILTVSNSKILAVSTLFSLLLLLMYNGEKGKDIKWLFYMFYPLHLIIIYFTTTLLH